MLVICSVKPQCQPITLSPVSFFLTWSCYPSRPHRLAQGRLKESSEHRQSRVVSTTQKESGELLHTVLQQGLENSSMCNECRFITESRKEAEGETTVSHYHPNLLKVPGLFFQMLRGTALSYKVTWPWSINKRVREDYHFSGRGRKFRRLACHANLSSVSGSTNLRA